MEGFYGPTVVVNITHTPDNYHHLHFYLADEGKEHEFQFSVGPVRVYPKGDFRWDISRHINKCGWWELGYRDVVILDSTERDEFKGQEWEIVIAEPKKAEGVKTLRISPTKKFPVDDLMRDALIITMFNHLGRPSFYLGSYVFKVRYDHIRQWGPYNEALSVEDTNAIISEILRSEWCPKGFDNLVLMDCTALQEHITSVYDVEFDGGGDKDEDGNPIYRTEPELTDEEKLLVVYQKHAEKVLKEAIKSLRKGVDPMRMSGDIMQALADVHKGIGMVAVEKHFLDKEKDKETKEE